MAAADPSEVAKILGVSVFKAKEMINEAKQLLLSTAIIVETADEVEEFLRKNVKRISTGSKKLDEILGGGVPTMTTTALVGHAATGKTQLAFQLTANVIGSGEYAAFIETEPKVFSPERIREICAHRGLKYDPSKILVVRADKIITPQQQLLAYEAVWKKVKDEKLNLRLLVVDSFSAKFREYYAGRESMSARSQEIARHMGILQAMASQLNCAVVLTGQVMGVPDMGAQLEARMRFGAPLRPYGGEFYLHSVCYLLFLEQVASDIWEATVADAPDMPRRSARFKITEGGIEDV